jgi:hypothetical protein
MNMLVHRRTERPLRKLKEDFLQPPAACRFSPNAGQGIEAPDLHVGGLEAWSRQKTPCVKATSTVERWARAVKPAPRRVKRIDVASI